MVFIERCKIYFIQTIKFYLDFELKFLRIRFYLSRKSKAFIENHLKKKEVSFHKYYSKNYHILFMKQLMNHPSIWLQRKTIYAIVTLMSRIWWIKEICTIIGVEVLMACFSALHLNFAYDCNGRDNFVCMISKYYSLDSMLLMCVYRRFDIEFADEWFLSSYVLISKWNLSIKIALLAKTI